MVEALYKILKQNPNRFASVPTIEMKTHSDTQENEPTPATLCGWVPTPLEPPGPVAAILWKTNPEFRAGTAPVRRTILRNTIIELQTRVENELRGRQWQRKKIHEQLSAQQTADASPPQDTKELDAALAHIATREHSVRNRTMLLTSVLAGLRVSELAALTIGDVRNADGTVRTEIYLAAHRVKHGHARTVYINTRLQAELAEYINERKWLDSTQPLFYTHRGPRRAFSPNTLAQHFHYVYKRVGIKQGSSHSGRKTFLTSLASQGISVFVLASLAGHKSITTTQKYVTVNADMNRRAVELV